MNTLAKPGVVLQGAGYRYPTGQQRACADIDLVVEAGQIMLLTGPTGCGKSTLLRLAAGLLQGHGAGQVEGQVLVEGRDPATTRPSQRVAALGLVGQEPADHLVAGTVADELAFAMESAGTPAKHIDERLPLLLKMAGLDLSPKEAETRDPQTLSGGQIQRLVIAAALSAGARTLLLDEPIAMLDPIGARTFLQTLRRLADDGVAVLLVEHRLPLCWPVADRLVVMEQGRVVDQATIKKIAPGHPVLHTLRRLGLHVPGMLDLADRLGITVAEVETNLAMFAAQRRRGLPVTPATGGEMIAQVQVPSFRYPDADRNALLEEKLTLLAGERIALLGANGAGKSTLMGLLSGALRSRGLRPLDDLVAVPQDPDLSLFCPTVAEELAYGPSERRDPAIAAVVEATAKALSIRDLLDRAPHALSRGQRLRVAVGAALSCRPRLLVLDEPTSGQDHEQVEAMLSSLSLALRDGVLIFATHDIDLALRHASRVLLLDRGRVIADGPPAAVLAHLPAGIPLVLPELSRLLLSLGIPPSSAAQLAADQLAADQLAADDLGAGERGTS